MTVNEENKNTRIEHSSKYVPQTSTCRAEKLRLNSVNENEQCVRTSKARKTSTAYGFYIKEWQTGRGFIRRKTSPFWT